MSVSLRVRTECSGYAAEAPLSENHWKCNAYDATLSFEISPHTVNYNINHCGN